MEGLRAPRCRLGWCPRLVRAAGEDATRPASVSSRVPRVPVPTGREQDPGAPPLSHSLRFQAPSTDQGPAWDWGPVLAGVWGAE